MAAVIISGANGSVTIPTAAGGQTIQITEWTATVEREIFETSNFDADTNWHTAQGGMAHLTGSATGYFDADTSGTESDKITAFGTEDDAPTAGFKLVAYEVSGTEQKWFEFAGILSNVTFNIAKTGGPVTISFNFESSGEVKEDTAF